MIAARGEVVAFLDDDAVADDTWIHELARVFERLNVIGAGGVARPRWVSGAAPRWLPDEFYWTIGCSYRGLPTETAPIRNPIGATMCFRRAIFDRVEGFSSSMGRVGPTPLGCEETELSIRARRASPGGVVLHVPAAGVEHIVSAERVSWSYFCSRCWAEGISKARLTSRVGSKDALQSERGYVLGTLPAGVLRGLSDGLHGDRAGYARAGAIALGLLVTVGRLFARLDRAGRMMGSQSHEAIPILLYHSVNDRPAAGQGAFTVSPTVFREHLRAIADNGRTPLTVCELARALRRERPLPARSLLVTFDDGFEDTRRAVELLLRAELTASVYVTSGFVGRTGMLRADGVRDLAELGESVELGAHSVSHPRLDELRAERAAEEIFASKTALEDIARTSVRSFAYPHGAHDRRVRAAVIDAGFTAAVAVKNALSHSRDDPYSLARVTVTAATSAQDIEILLTGSGAQMARGRERVRTRGYRSVRRLRRRLGWTVA